MATAKIADTGIDLAGIANLANLFLGKTTTSQNSGGTSTTGSRTVSESVDPSAVAATVKSILEGTSGLAAVSSGQRKAGLYNSSTNQLLSNDLLARTAAEASKLNKTTTTSVNEGTVDNKATNTVVQPPISAQTAGKGALLLGGLSLIPADVKKNILGMGKTAASAGSSTPDMQALFRSKEIADQNASDTAAIVSNPVSGNSGTSAVSGVGSSATGNDANIVSLGGDDGSGLADSVLSGASSGTNYVGDYGTDAASAGVDLIDNADPGVVGDYGDLPDFDYDNFDLGFARGGQVKSRYADGGPVNTGLRARANPLQAQSDPTDVDQVVGSLTGRIGQSGDRTTGGTKAVNNSATVKGGKSIENLQPSESMGGSTSGNDTGTNSGSVGNATSNAAVINGIAPMLVGLVNPIMGLAAKAAQTLGGVKTQSINPISQIIAALANTANGGNEAPEAPDPEGSVSVGTPIGDDGVAMAGFTGSIAGNDPSSADSGIGSAPDVGTVGGSDEGEGTGPGSDTGAGATGGSDSGSDGGDAGSAGDAFTKGGDITGPGTATSDSIPIKVSDGEFVMNAEAVKAFGPIIEHMNNLGRKMMDKKSGYARGGVVKMGRKC